jgi:hypothetical protein
LTIPGKLLTVTKTKNQEIKMKVTEVQFVGNGVIEIHKQGGYYSCVVNTKTIKNILQDGFGITKLNHLRQTKMPSPKIAVLYSLVWLKMYSRHPVEMFDVIKSA